MFEITLDQLLKVTGGVIQRGSFAGDEVIRGISVDSRSIREGNLFVAVPGERFDGHEFVKGAVDRGAQAAVVAGNRWSATDQKGLGEVAVISVQDTKKALRDMACWYKAKFEIPTVAVTGTNGKTTTKEMIAQVLSAKLRVVRSPRSYNNLIGVPLTIFRLNPGSEALVVELGMSQPGEIGILTRTTKPDIGVITNIGPAHLESMHSLERIAQAKFELADNMASSRTLVFNADDPILKKRIEEKRSGERIVSFGIENQADFRADQIRSGPEGLISFRLNRDLTIDLLLLGRHNVYNALAALAVSSLLGVDPAGAKERLNRYTPSELRMELVHIKDVTVINDSYNANPVSVTKALETLQEIRIPGRKIAVLADMLELGEKAADFHLGVGRKAAELGIDLLLVVGELARHIAQGARERGMQAEQVQTFETNQQVSHYLLENLKPGDMVLVKGSRKMRAEEVVMVLRSLYGRQN